MNAMRASLVAAVLSIALFPGCDEGPVYVPPDGPQPAVCDSVMVYDSTWVGDSLVLDSQLVPLWHYDLIIVASILEQNNLSGIAAEQVTEVDIRIDTCGRVVELDLHALQLQSLPPQVGELSSLRVLRVYNNDIGSLPASLGNLRKLHTLQAQRCGLEEIPDELCDIDSLQTLFLHDNELERLPDDMGNLSSLVRLELAGNSLDSLPESLMFLEHLSPSYLTVGGNHLCTVSSAMADWLSAMSYYGPQWYEHQVGCSATAGDTGIVRELLDSIGLATVGVGEVAGIREGRVASLDLSGRSLEGLPAQLGELVGLESLDLSDNDIDTLAAGVFDSLRAMVTLNLSENLLDGDLGGLQGLSMLQVLDLSANELSAAPDGLDLLDSLRELDLSDNQLDSQALAGWSAMSLLEEIDLSGNAIGALPLWFGSLGSLVMLDVSGNALDSLPALDGLGALEVLRADSNALAVVPALDSLLSLRVLTLSGNLLVSIPNSVGALVSLDTLDLGGNELTGLPTTVDNLTDIERVYVDANSICAPSVLVEAWLMRHAETDWEQLQLCPGP